MKTRTLDRQTYFISEQIGKKRVITNDGYLLCQDVPIARTGEMLYMPYELDDEGAKPGKDGIVRVTRDAVSLFSPETIASFEGRPVTNNHPDEDVTPENWRKYTAGVVQNVRQGQGAEANMLLADLLIQDSSAIDAVNKGKREVSCGYAADYEWDAPGKGRQTNIIGNHVALVESGRCGQRCSIQDHQGVKPMTSKNLSFLGRIRKAFRDQDEEALNSALADAPQVADADSGATSPVSIVINGVPTNGEPASPNHEAATHNADDDPMEAILAAIKSLAERIDKLEAKNPAQKENEQVTEDAGNPDLIDQDAYLEDKGGKGTQDSAALVNSWRETVALAEILAPGIQVSTFDAKATRKLTIDRMCLLRKKALTQAALTDSGAQAIAAVGGHASAKAIAGLTCDAAAILFKGAAKQVAEQNRVSAVSAQPQRKTLDSREQNEANQKFWSDRTK